MGGRQGLRPVDGGHAGPPAVGVLRGPAHRQRPAGHAPHRGPRVQGRLPPVQDHAGLARAAPGGLGLPRPAGRDRRRAGARLRRQARHRAVRHRGVQRPVPRVRRAARRRLRRADPTAWATGSTCPPPTGRWTRPTSRASGGRSSRSSTRACWSRTTGWRPYCPRCGTGLSDHEVAQGYETLTDPSVYVRLPVTSGEWAGKADLLIWTTTPWTLPSNTAVAVHPDVTYVVARTEGGSGTFVVAEPLLTAVLGRGRRGPRPHHRPRLGAGHLPAALRAGRVPRAGRLPELTSSSSPST